MPQTALLLVSPPGCGKTKGVEALAEALGSPFWVQVGGQEDPVDTCGVIVPDHENRCSQRYVPAYWRAACDRPYVLLFDEVTACTAEQKAAMLRATDDGRCMAGHQLHDETIVIAACNPPEMAAGSARELSAPELSRFRHRRVGPEAAINWMIGGPGLVLHPRAIPKRSYPPSMVRVVGAYLQKNPGAALASKEEIQSAVEKQEPFACPRAWTRAATEEPDDPAIWGEFVGAQWAAAFAKWLHLADLPDPLAILDGSSSAVPKRGDAVMATAGALQSALGADPIDEHLRNALKWMGLAAEKGFGADCAVAVLGVVRGVGEVRTSHFRKFLAPFEKLLDAAGK